MLEETVIIFTSDNGTDAPIVSKYLDGEMEWGKGKTTDNGTHAPLVVSWKGHTKQGVIDSSLIDFSDFLPTLCDISGIKVSKSLDVDGISFLPQILGKENNKKKFIHTWYYPRPYQQNISGDNWGRKEFEWTRNKIFKLYSDGRFYNVKDDFYEKNPDFIYLDGPSTSSNKKNVNGLSFNNNFRMPLSVDILKYEYLIEPGSFILVDGRVTNAIFLKNHLYFFLS